MRVDVSKSIRPEILIAGKVHWCRPCPNLLRKLLPIPYCPPFGPQQHHTALWRKLWDGKCGTRILVELKNKTNA